MMKKILIIDDKKNICKVLTEILSQEGYKVKSVRNGWQGLQKARTFQPDLIVCDVRMPEMDGIEFFQSLKGEGLDIPVIFITAFGSIPLAVETIKEGAVDFLSKPLDYEQLKRKISEAIGRPQKRTKKGGNKNKYYFKKIVGSSKVIKELYKTINSVANKRTTVLIRGESGTGKELVARAIHYFSDRCQAPFVAVNCAALNRDILESELFGHKKGSFTGAIENKEGKFEVADGGTLLLDEVSEISLSAQAKLLRVIQEKAFERVGDNRTITVDVKIIATTNRNLEELVSRGEFRKDLFYRLNVVPIYIPPLRERKEDIGQLTNYFVEEICRRENIPQKEISPEVLTILKDYNWPGNVRELKNLIERVLVFSRSNYISLQDLPQDWPGLVSARENDDLYERREIVNALKKTFGNKTRAAELLDIPRRTLYNRLNKYNIEEKEYRGE